MNELTRFAPKESAYILKKQLGAYTKVIAVAALSIGLLLLFGAQSIGAGLFFIIPSVFIVWANYKSNLTMETFSKEIVKTTAFGKTTKVPWNQVLNYEVYFQKMFLIITVNTAVRAIYRDQNRKEKRVDLTLGHSRKSMQKIINELNRITQAE